jgi:hypothetical protein
VKITATIETLGNLLTTTAPAMHIDGEKKELVVFAILETPMFSSRLWKKTILKSIFVNRRNPEKMLKNFIFTKFQRRNIPYNKYLYKYPQNEFPYDDLVSKPSQS